MMPRRDVRPADASVPASAGRIRPLLFRVLPDHPTALRRIRAKWLCVMGFGALVAMVWSVVPPPSEDMALLAAAGKLEDVEPAGGLKPAPETPQERVPDLLAVAVREMEERKLALDAREREVAAREQALRALAAALNTQLDELRTIQAQQDQQKRELAEEQEERAKRLARLYESMKPKKAASILDGLPPVDVANITRRMRDDKAAAVIQQMAPAQASALSEQLSKE